MLDHNSHSEPRVGHAVVASTATSWVSPPAGQSPADAARFVESPDDGERPETHEGPEQP